MSEQGEGLTRLDFSALTLKAADTAKPFLEAVADKAGERLVSLVVVGSAVTTDWRPDVSDINTIIVVDRVETRFLDELAEMGKAFGKRGIEAPLIMTPEYIERSRDSFPLEFLSFKAAHVTVYGDDLFGGLEFERADVRLAAEREAKSLIMNLRRGYVRCLGDRDRLRGLLIASLNSLLPVFCAILYLKDLECPLTRAMLTSAGTDAAGVHAEPFHAVLALRESKTAPAFDELRGLFEGLHDAVNSLSTAIDRTR